ncbi:MAG: amidase family protein [Pseudomonadota bacterium]|nr:amidase family protein [Pseudomonadota bacterium]
MGIEEYDELDGVAMGELVREKQVSAIELVEEAIKRIELLNPQLNAIVYKMYDLALETAKNPVKGRFSGVPFLLKDITSHFQGTPTTSGSRLLSNVSPSNYDSEIVKRFKRAGLITVGKTNTPEFALAATTEPALRGATCNPWNLNHTTGGSSGGSAAAVAARIVPIGHGGDGGGSLRMPGSCCGIVGFKPSRMLIPHGPDASQIWEACCGEFVMTRTVRDTAVMLDNVAGQDIGAYYSAPAIERSFEEERGREPTKLKIAWSAVGPDAHDTHPDCVDAVEHAAQLCSDLGHHVEEAVPQIPENLRETVGDAFLNLIAIETAGDIQVFSELIGRKATDEDIEPAVWSFAAHGQKFSGIDALRFRRTLHSTARAIGPFFEKYDVYLSPTLAKPPVPLGNIDMSVPNWETFFGNMFEFMPFTSLFNITGSAGVSLPLWWNESGLPIGCQFVTRMGRDGLLINLSSQIEKAHSWHNKKPTL